ncbi:MAG: heme exporter protein CcmB [Gammaproteobacteria bacterium]|nr:heme exporter protein CcmB [Gammaproteobacteria bacterium]
MSTPGALFAGQFRRELTAALRNVQEALNPLVFLFLAITLFALGVGAEPAALERFAPGIIWVLVLLANLLALEGLFRRDFDDGTLEQMVLLGRPLFVPVLAKTAAQWCLSGLAMTLLAPLAALLLYLPMEVLGITVLSLLVGSPALTLFGAVGAALTVGLRGGGVLLALLILPLYIPILIFGAGAISLAMAGVDVSAQIYLLTAISMLAVTVAPFAVQAALRISLEQS